MDGCVGHINDPDQGFVKPCPLRASCARYRIHIGKHRRIGYAEITPPYDFDDRNCAEYKEVP